MSTAATEERTGPGRPQRRDAAGTTTSERLLDAAAAACIEHGFDGTTVSDIARRAGIKTPSIYNHYSSKTELLVTTARHAFDKQFAGLAAEGQTPAQVVQFFMADDLRDTRRLVIELHSAATRHPDVAGLLSDWHRDAAQTWRPFAGGPDPEASVKAFFVLLLGLCHLDDLDSVQAAKPGLESAVGEVVGILFAD